MKEIKFLIEINKLWRQRVNTLELNILRAKDDYTKHVRKRQIAECTYALGKILEMRGYGNYTKKILCNVPLKIRKVKEIIANIRNRFIKADNGLEDEEN